MGVLCLAAGIVATWLLGRNRVRFGMLFASNRDGDLHPLAKAAESGHQPVHREPPKVGIADA